MVIDKLLINWKTRALNTL